MTPSFAARRRAEEFDALVEGASSPTTASPRDAELLELVGALRVDAAGRGPSRVRRRPARAAAGRGRRPLLVPTERVDRLQLPARRTPRRAAARRPRRRPRRRRRRPTTVAVAAQRRCRATRSTRSSGPRERPRRPRVGDERARAPRCSPTPTAASTRRELLGESDEAESRAQVAGTLATFTDQADAGRRPAGRRLRPRPADSPRSASCTTSPPPTSPASSSWHRSVPADARGELVRGARPRLQRDRLRGLRAVPGLRRQPDRRRCPPCSRTGDVLPPLPAPSRRPGHPSAGKPGRQHGTRPADAAVARWPRRRRRAVPRPAPSPTAAPPPPSAASRRTRSSELADGAVGGLTGGTAAPSRRRRPGARRRDRRRRRRGRRPAGRRPATRSPARSPHPGADRRAPAPTAGQRKTDWRCISSE